MKKFFFLIFIWLLFPSYVFSEEIFLSLKKNKVNVRYGPSFESPVKYIYKKINLPIKQIDKKENWRRIIDSKNNSGWIHWSQLKKINDIIGKKEIDKIDDRDDRLVIKAIITQIKQTKKPMEKFTPINPPSIVAMPLPPLNFNQIGKQ